MLPLRLIQIKGFSLNIFTSVGFHIDIGITRVLGIRNTDCMTINFVELCKSNRDDNGESDDEFKF